MSRYAAFLLLLAIVPWNFCAADSEYPDVYDPTDAPFDPTTASVKPTTATPESTTTKDAPTTTVAPTTTATSTTAAPTTPKTTQAPTTTTVKPTTAAPTTTTAAPTTTNTTEATNATTITAAPNTTVTSTTPTPTTTPAPLPNPTANTYQLKNGNDTCLMVKFGLRIGYHGDKYEEMNLNPNTTTATGVCAEDNSTLVLHADNLTLSFIFHNDTKKFSLVVLSATGNLTSGTPVSELNNTLSLWQASLGSSYMCNKQQSSNITTKLTISTFELRVQPFGIKKDTFSTAEECFLDSDLSFLVPIAVGVALSFLIILVLISYLIGRRKSRTGYQSV